MSGNTPKNGTSLTTKVCGSCEISYPPDCVSLLCVNGKYYEVCAICALVHRNEAHGAPKMPFKGEMAAAMYERAWEFIDAKEVRHPLADSEFLPPRDS